jgi:hypothetical protein
MLGLEMIDTCELGATWQIVERSVAFAQGDRVLLGNLGEKFSKTPDTALVERLKKSFAVKPESFQGGRIRAQFRENEFQQVATTGAAEDLGGGNGGSAAGDAAEVRGRGSRLRD